MERIQKQAAKLAKHSQVTYLKHIRGGPRWDREGRRRHFPRTMVRGLWIGKETLSWKVGGATSIFILRATPVKGPARPSSLGGVGRRAEPNPAPVLLAQSPCPLSGVSSCWPPSLGQEGMPMRPQCFGKQVVSR